MRYRTAAENAQIPPPSLSWHDGSMHFRMPTIFDHLRDAWEDAVRDLAAARTDAVPLDPHPDRCWRCDARPSCDDLGLCEPCREVLT